jgi:TctA family transporter
VNEHTKHVLDAGAIGTTLGALLGWLPHIAAALSIVWTLIRIIETDTAKRLIQWVKERKQ